MAYETWEHIWEQVPAINRTDVMRADIEAAPPKLAIAMLKDLFMIDNPNERGLMCSCSREQLLPVLMELYALKGGSDLETEQAMWSKLLAD